MDFALTDEHRMVRDMVRQFAEKEAAPRIKELDQQGQWDVGLIKRMGELGILGLVFPECCCSDYLSASCSRSMAVPIAQVRWRSNEQGRPGAAPAVR